MVRNSKAGICTYCGQYGSLTKDHIPPKTIFPKPRPNNLITIPCCLICNGAAKKDDEYFGIMMALRDKSQNHPSANKVLPKIFDGLHHKNAWGFRKKIFHNFSVKNVVTTTGILLGRYPVFEEEAAPIIRVMERITKGLYYLETKKSYPQHHCINIRFGRSLIEGSIEKQRNLAQALGIFKTVIPKVIGNGEFRYWLRFADDDNCTFGALVEIYNSRYFLCYSVPVNSEAAL